MCYKITPELTDTEKRIRSAIKRQEITLGKFKALNKTLESTNIENKKLLENLNEMADNMEDKWGVIDQKSLRRWNDIKKKRTKLGRFFQRFGTESSKFIIEAVNSSSPASPHLLPTSSSSSGTQNMFLCVIQVCFLITSIIKLLCFAFCV